MGVTEAPIGGRAAVATHPGKEDEAGVTSTLRREAARHKHLVHDHRYCCYLVSVSFKLQDDSGVGVKPDAFAVQASGATRASTRVDRVAYGLSVRPSSGARSLRLRRRDSRASERHASGDRPRPQVGRGQDKRSTPRLIGTCVRLVPVIGSTSGRVPVASVPAYGLDLRRDGAKEALLDRFCERIQLEAGRPAWDRRRALRSVLDHTFVCGAQTVVVEARYTDLDYRDEYAQYYSTTFRSYSPVAHRMHFFADPPPKNIDNPHVAASFAGLTYLGYAVIRPVTGAPVGRTMLQPPQELLRWVTCTATDQANLFGAVYEVTAAPFMSGDAQLGVCAHAAGWMAAYYHRLRYGAARWLPSDIAQAALSEFGVRRLVPTAGLTAGQLTEAMRRLNMSPLVYSSENMPRGETLDKVARRYLDSALPVLVGTQDHAFVLVGYRRSTGRGQKVDFICNDDGAGPYQIRPIPKRGQPGEWLFLIVPLPSELYVPGERAEPLGIARLQKEINDRATDTAMRNRLDGVEYITSAILSNDYKRFLGERGAPDDVISGYGRIGMPKWIWVVEAIDRSAFLSGQPSVLAEAIIDCTDHSSDMRTLAWRVPGLLRHWDPDSDLVGDFTLQSQPEVMLQSVAATSWRRPARLR